MIQVNFGNMMHIHNNLLTCICTLLIHLLPLGMSTNPFS